jgi:hypothetical protein
VPKVKKIRGLNLPGTPWATAACCGSPVYSFFSSKIVYMSTYKNKQKSTQLKSFLLHFWSSNLKPDHLCEFNFLASLKFGKYKATNQTLLNYFPCRLSYGCTTYHSPGLNRKIWGTRLITQPCPERCRFCVSSGCKLDRNYSARRSYRPVDGFTELITRRFISLLSNSVRRHTKNVLLL